MIVKLPVGSYARFVGDSFSEEELQNYMEHVDYFTVASYSELPKIEGITSINKQCALIFVRANEEDQILTYRKITRNEVRRSYRTTEYKVEINCTPPDELYSFHMLCEKERQWKPVPPEELLASLTVCVRYKEELIAGMSVYSGNGVLRVGRIFSRRRSDIYHDLPKSMISAASRMVVHELTRYAVRNNIAMLDLGGIDPDDPSKAGISQFKLLFGSEIRPVWLGRFYGSGYEAINAYANKYDFDLS
ncbi:MAG: hypothetical protein M0R30_08945 [Methanoregula sp.]|uniref:hypothetical protein n=1 Tax=Methanoregula sp. TaxID=2052170 RepID=UPI0025FDAF1D|nr:hypothetical protein [Methanoregula sp.]MCK9631759.1 hypothetical protein [Methanoregula sp.]